MSVQWDPNAGKRIAKAAFEEKLRRASGTVSRTVCPDHPERPRPKLIMGAQPVIVACCPKAAELASKNGGLGPVTWREAS